MEDILLTHAEQKAVRDGVRWSGSFKDLHDRIDEALCRAQVRKVYGYIRTHWVHARQLDCQTTRDNTVLLTIRSEDWQALREAAGEEK